MPREIFGEVSNPSVKLGSQAWYTVPLSILVHSALLAVVVVVPLVATDVLPSPPAFLEAFVPDAALPEPPAPRRAPDPVQRQQRNAVTDPSIAPTTAPENIQPETERPLLPSTPTADGGLPAGSGVGTSLGPGVNIAPTPAPLPPAPPQIYRPGGNIKTPTKIHHAAPVYPSIAQQARVEGMVIIEATIGSDGRVKDVRILRSKPLLDQAAIDAVMQWRFTPTLLNGLPVPILMTVTVNFQLH